MHEWVNPLFFPPSQQSANVKIQKTAAHPKLAAQNRLVKDAIGKLWGGVENRWVIWPWRSSAIYVWKHQPGVSNMSGQFDELMDKKKGTLRCSRSQRAEKHNTKKQLYFPQSGQPENAQNLDASRCTSLVFTSLIPTTNSKLSSLQEAGWTKCCTLGLNSWFHSVLRVRVETATVNQIYTCTCAALLYYKWTTLRSHII